MRTPPTQSDSVVAQALATASNFFSSGLRQKVDQLMNILWAGGVNNPMDSIEQISYLLFLRLLTEKDEVLASLDKKYTRIFSGKWARYAWGNFVTLTGDDLFNAIRDAIEKLARTPRPHRHRQTPLQPRHAQDLRPPHAPRRRPGHPRHGLVRPRRPRPQGRHVRVSAEQAVAVRHQRPVPHPAPHHRPDRGARGSAAGPAHLRSRLRHGGLPHLRLHPHSVGSTPNPPT